MTDIVEKKDKMDSCQSCGKTDCQAKTRQPQESQEDFLDRQKLESRMCRIGRKIVVLSGKGGVGKSTVAVNLAAALAGAGTRVGLLDIDIHGPSIPTMVGLEGAKVSGPDGAMLPVEVDGIKVMSIGFFLEDQDHAVVWRGPMKYGMIKQFLKDVDWGQLDFLVIDSPPGTGDEPLSVCQLVAPDGAVIVTTPQRVAAVDVRKTITFCRLLDVPVLGVVENMSGFACPKCGQVTPILSSGGGRRISDDMGVPFLGEVPIDPALAEAGDSGRVFLRHHPSGPTAKALEGMVKAVLSTGEQIKSTKE
jgi:Mrp family chromosome partitioning ATPase